MNPDFAYRVRLLLYPQGKIQISCQILKENNQVSLSQITLAKERVNSQDIFLYHKTTKRKLYNQRHQQAREAGFFDIIFRNERGEITEGAISNIFIRHKKMYYTPPVSCGLLNGVFRQYYIKKNSHLVRERILRKEDLLRAEAIYLTNAVQGMRQVRLF